MTIETQSRPFDNRETNQSLSHSTRLSLQSKADNNQSNPETNHRTNQQETSHCSIFVSPMVFVVVLVVDFIFICFLGGVLPCFFLPIIIREPDVEPSSRPSKSRRLQYVCINLPCDNCTLEDSLNSTSSPMLSSPYRSINRQLIEF